MQAHELARSKQMNILLTIARYLLQHPEIALLLFIAILAGWFFPEYDEKVSF